MATLAQLTDEVILYTTYDDADFVAEIPRFIEAAEERIFYLVQLPSNLKSTTALSMTSGVSTLALPDDFLAAEGFAVILASGEYAYLLPKELSYIREVWPNPTSTGVPAAYAIQTAAADSTTIIIGPTPASSYATLLSYFYRPASLTTNPAGGTWLSNHAYDTLLYGTLSEASNYLKRVAGIDNMGDKYEERFIVGLQGLKNLGEVRDRKDVYRNGERRKAE